MTDRTVRNLRTAFVGEAKAYFRLQAYAQRAAEEGLDRLALLFRAVAEAERVHAGRNLGQLGELVVKDTQSNLKQAFESEEKVAGVHYLRFAREAEKEGDAAAATAFGQMRDVEAEHARLYRNALQFLVAEDDPEYHVCDVCGYVAEGRAPEQCPVCGVGPERFIPVV